MRISRPSYNRERFTTAELVERVRRYALDHYNDGGWDVIVEAYTDDELAALLGKTTTLAGAFRKLQPIISIYVDREADAENSAF